MWPTSLTTGFNMHFFSLLVVIFVDYISDYRTWAGTTVYTLASLFTKVGKCTKVTNRDPRVQGKVLCWRSPGKRPPEGMGRAGAESRGDGQG